MRTRVSEARESLAFAARPPVDAGSPPACSRELEIVRTLLLAHAAGNRASPPAPLLHALTFFLFMKAAVTCLALILGYPIVPAGAPLGSSTHTLLYIGFAGAGTLMALGGQRDRRARYLGSFFVIIALAFAREPLRQAFGRADNVVAGALRIDCDPLLPLFLWLFVREFPRTVSPSRRVITTAGVWAATGWAAVAALHGAISGSAAASGLGSGHPGFEKFYWNVTFALTLLALAMPYVRLRDATPSERTRVAWFTTGLFAGIGPLLVEVIAFNLSDAYAAWSARPSVLPAIGFVVSSSLLTIPVTTLYAVGSHRVVDVSFALRRALQCTLLKSLSIVVAVSPIFALALLVYVHRSEPVDHLAQALHIQVLLGLSVMGLLLLAFADRLLRCIDALFFRPPYDPHCVIATVTAEMARAANYAAVADRVAAALQATLDPVATRVAVLARGDESYADLVTGQPVSNSMSRVVEVLARCKEPPVTLSNELLGETTQQEAAWLAAAVAELLVPLRDSDGHVVGVIALGGKKDDRQYSDHDARLIANLCGAAQTAIERLAWRQVAHPGPPPIACGTPAASECADCGLMHPSTHAGRCDACSHPLERASVPLVVSGKFRVERRVGRGGMAVVYCAVDPALNRRVAIKALQYLSGAAEQRLRAEARTMAAVSHANVAAVYSLESWNRRPLLIAEYLERGTLADVLGERPVEPATVIGWGLGLAAGLMQLHREDIVHGDIKPSNIGFDRDGVPKLLDFGLSTTYQKGEPTTAGRLGTPFYVCPEALASGPQLPEFDLWSLALVLYEALAGERLRAAFARGRVIPPDIRELRTDVPAPLADFFAKALNSRVDARPRSAAEFTLWLRHAALV